MLNRGSIQTFLLGLMIVKVNPSQQGDTLPINFPPREINLQVYEEQTLYMGSVMSKPAFICFISIQGALYGIMGFNLWKWKDLAQKASIKDNPYSYIFVLLIIAHLITSILLFNLEYYRGKMIWYVCSNIICLCMALAIVKYYSIFEQQKTVNNIEASIMENVNFWTSVFLLSIAINLILSNITIALTNPVKTIEINLQQLLLELQDTPETPQLAALM